MKTGVLTILIAIVCAFSYLQAAVYHVGLEAEYVYHEIQAAVDVCENGDTVYVHPGIYTQSVEVLNKNISLLSMYAVSGAHLDIANTVISGNNGELSVSFTQSIERSVFQGFTIRDCINNFNAAISVYQSMMDLKDCIITNNRNINENGSTISIGYMSNVLLSGCSIYDNYGLRWAGIYKNMTAILQFDPIHRNSIYSNRGGACSDIFYDYMPGQVTSEPLDTLYLDVATSDFTDPLCYWGISNVVVNQAAEPKVTTDLYVAPWGNDSNAGTDSEAPLRTIYKATRLACPAEGDSLVIHVAAGTYAFNNFDDLRLGVSPGVSLRGDAANPPMLDGQQIGTIVSNAGTGTMKLQNLILKNASVYAVWYRSNFLSPFLYPAAEIFLGKLELNNIRFHNNYMDVSAGPCHDVLLSNIVSDSDPGYRPFSSLQLLFCSYVKIENSFFTGVKEHQDVVESSGVNCIGNGNSEFGEFPQSNMDIINTIMAQNLSQHILTISDDVHVNLINSMIIDNTNDSSTGGALTLWNGKCDLYNSVIWNNRPFNILRSGSGSYLKAHYSLVEDALQNYISPAWMHSDHTITYDDTNLPFAAMPTFVGNGIHQYMPISSSSLIDAGSLVYPDGLLVPLTDLAGNPRVYGDNIDLGPYEWQGTEFDFTCIQDGYTVTFIPSCNQPITDIHWDFDMDGTIDSEELMPTHTYRNLPPASVGCYINNGTGGITKRDFVVFTGITDQEQTPQPVRISAFPNPFTHSVSLNLDLKRGRKYSVSIYDVKGRIVKKLIQDASYDSASSHIWDGKDEVGKTSASGLYFVRLETAKETVIRKIVKLK